MHKVAALLQMIYRMPRIQSRTPHYVCVRELPGVEPGTATVTDERLYGIGHGEPILLNYFIEKQTNKKNPVFIC